MSHALDGFVTNLTGGLTRLFCKRCKEETIHRGLACTRTGCGTTHVAYPVRSIYTRSIAAMPRKRGVFNQAHVKVELNQHGPGWQQVARDADVLRRHASGESTSTIALVHGLSAERVRQIIRAARMRNECSTLGTGPLEPENIA